MLIYQRLKAKKGSFPTSAVFREYPFGERVHGLFGLSPRSLLPERPVGERGYARYSILSARKGIQVVPRKVYFRPEHDCSGFFLFKGVFTNGKRIT